MNCNKWQFDFIYAGFGIAPHNMEPNGKPKKILFFDVETTGVDARENDIIQISGLFEIDGEVVEEFDLRCQPRNYENISESALETTGLTVDQIKEYPEQSTTFRQLVRLFDKHIDKYDREDKFYPAGYNVRFDLDFLQQFFIKNGESYGCGSYQNWRAIDGLALAYFLNYLGKLDLENYKLETLCNYLEIPIIAHDALSDIKATRKVVKKLIELL